MKKNPVLAAVVFMTAMEAVGCNRSPKGAAVRPSTPALTAEQCQAIEVAKRFVVENGYTDSPPSRDASRIDRELGEGGMPMELLMRIRQGALKRHPYGLNPGTPPDTSGWTVVFEQTPEFLARPSVRDRPDRGPWSRGRGVLVRPTASGLETSMVHIDLILDRTAVRLPSEQETASACAAVAR